MRNGNRKKNEIEINWRDANNAATAPDAEDDEELMTPPHAAVLASFII